MNDIATGLTTALCKDGQSTPTANIKMGGFKFTGLGAGTLNGDSIRFEQLPSATNLLPVASGGTGSGTAAGARTNLGAMGGGDIQGQTSNAATTTGTPPAYVAAFSPVIASLVANKTRVNLTFAAGNAGPVATTLDIGTGPIGLKQYDSTGAKVDPTITAGMMGDIEYDGTHHVLLNRLSPGAGASSNGSSTNLQASATGTNANISITADELVVESASNAYQTLRAVNVTGTLTASGANGLDDSLPQTVTITIASPGVVTLNGHGFPVNAAVVLATTGALPTGLTAGTTYYVVAPTANTFQLSATKSGAAINTSGTQSGTHTIKSVLAASTWYSSWVIWNGTTTAALHSSSQTAPVLPTGYTHKARTGWVYTDSTANKFPLSFKQLDHLVQYQLTAAGNLTGWPAMASGVAGTISSSAYTGVAIAVGSFVPPTASVIEVIMTCAAPAVNVFAAASSNAQRSGYTSTYPPEININWNTSNGVSGPIFLESSSIYWASTAAACGIGCIGWQDNL